VTASVNEAGPGLAGPRDDHDREQAIRGLVTPVRLRALFAPRRIALVGASDTSGWSKLIVDSLDKVGFDGSWIPVHPKHASAFGRPAVPSLSDLDEPVDLAWILAPQRAVEAVLADAAAAGVRSAVVLAAGYGEAGPEGVELQQRLVDIAIDHQMTLLGPNGLGYINATARVAPYGLGMATAPKAGGVGVVLQSGALATTVLNLHRERGVGLSLLVSMGNEAMVRAADVMEYLIEDESTKVISLFLEGVRSAERFTALAARALQAGKPVVALKVGSTPEGQRSAAAHTGAVAGDDAVADAAFRQFGVIRVASLEELVVTAGLLAEGPALRGRRMGVITASGGCNDFIVDRASAEGIKIPKLLPETVRRLREEAVPDFGSADNPVDVTGYGLADDSLSEETQFSAALEAVTADPSIDFVLFMGVYAPESRQDDGHDLLDRQTRYLTQIMARSPVPVVPISEAFGSLAPYPGEFLDRHGLHLLGGMNLGIGAIGHALRWHERRSRGPAPEPPRPGPAAGELAAPPGLDGPWPEIAGRQLLQSAGVPVVPARLAPQAADAVAAAAALGYPVVLKAQAEGLVHKSDIGGVMVGLGSAAAVADAFAVIAERTRAARPAARFDGVLVSPMRRGGLELLAGVTRDPVFGLTLAVGLGGVWVELLRDVGLRVLPVTRPDVIELLGELRSAPLLNGHRGAEPVNVDRVADAVLLLCDAAAALGPELVSIEVNPFWCRGDEIEALDVLIITDSSRAASDARGPRDRREA
jgi:acyl-CoA synthetase (NDP forming)